MDIILLDVRDDSWSVYFDLIRNAQVPGSIPGSG
jgi:hypothetical protein